MISLREIKMNNVVYNKYMYYFLIQNFIFYHVKKRRDQQIHKKMAKHEFRIQIAGCSKRDIK